MKKSFLLGAVSGMSVLTLAVPVISQISSAQTESSTTTTSASATADVPFDHPMFMPLFTQEGIQKRIDHDNAYLTNIDALVSAQKAATMTHRAALQSALSITDDTERQAAVRAADEAMRTTMKAAFDANPALKDAMHPGFGMGKRMMHFRGPDMLLEKLGMTHEELKAAIESGKTIEEIAQEKGVTLPPRPMGGMMHHRFDVDEDETTDASSSSAQ